LSRPQPGPPEPESAAPMIDIARQVFLAALAQIEPKDLVAWGKANPTQFFATLLKLIPEDELRGADFADVSDTPMSESEWKERFCGD
jgi:hypothetical protein